MPYKDKEYGKKRAKERYEENKEQQQAKARKYYNEHKEEQKIKRKIKYEENIERGREINRRSRIKNSEKNKIFNREPKRRFVAATSYAKRQNKEFSITYEQYETLINKECYYCNDNFNSVKNATGIGLDRLNNSIGYHLENVVPCCKICNLIRGDNLSSEETKVAIKAVIDYRAINNIIVEYENTTSKIFHGYINCPICSRIVGVYGKFSKIVRHLRDTDNGRIKCDGSGLIFLIDKDN